ncbi:MAG: ATP-binding cassette domain-containing protein [Blautia sp.]
MFDGINFYETLTPAKVGKSAGGTYKQWDGHMFSRLSKAVSTCSEYGNQISLSKGMKMKLCIAVALSHNPKLLILDEATSGLDPVMRDDILDVFLEFVQDENHSILMSSHITTDLEKVADYITFIHQGKVLFCKTKDELRYNYGIIRCGAALFDQLDKAEITGLPQR